MKKIFHYLSVASLILFAACGNNSSIKDNSSVSEKTIIQKTEMVPLDLFSAKINATINAPKGATATADDFDATVSGGDGFSMTIETFEASAPTIAEIKKDVEKNEVNQFVKYIADEAEGIVYQSKAFNDEFHFNYIVSIGDKTYHIYDRRGKTFTQENVQQMFDAAKTMKAK